MRVWTHQSLGRASWTTLSLALLTLVLIGLVPVYSDAQSGSSPLPVSTELVIAADGSGSISDAELAVQREGYAAAITDPQVLSVIQSSSFGRLAVAYIEWGGADSQEIIADWHLIETAEDAERFAAVLRQTPRKAYGWNSISNAIFKGAQMIEGNAYDGFNKVIDVSGDSGQRGGRPLEAVRQAVIAQGITINGLALNYRGGGMSGPRGEPLELHYKRDIIGGPGAFVMTVEEPEEFHDAILNKLVRELAFNKPETDPATDTTMVAKGVVRR